MFYSPKKDIQRYVTIKNNEIKTLKQTIESQKITQENIQNAKKRLDKLKAQYNILASQNYRQLIQTIKNNQDKKLLIQQQILLKQKEIGLKKHQQSDVATMKKDILDKIKKTKERIQKNKQKNTHVTSKRQDLDQKIMNIVKLNEKLRQQKTQLNDLQTSAKKQLHQCKNRLDQYTQKSKRLQQQMSQIGTKIVNQKDQGFKIKAQTQIQQLKIQNLQLKIQNLIHKKSILLEQKQKVQNQKLISKQRTQLNRHQSISDEIMKILIKVSQAMKQSKQKQKQNCQRQIKQKLIQLEMSQCVNNELSTQIGLSKDKIQDKQKKITKIRGQMDKISVKDVQLVSMILGKEKVKNQQKTPLKNIDQNKQNIKHITVNVINQKDWKLSSFLQFAQTSDQNSIIF